MRPLLLFGSMGALFLAGSVWAGPSGKTPPAPTASSSATAPSAAPTTTSAAPAASSAPIAAEIDATARQLFVDGVAAFERQEYAKAYASLLAAWNVKKHWQIAATLGAAALQVDKPVEAAEYFAYYERESPADRKEKAKALLAEAAAKVGTIVLTVEPPDAVVTVDGVASEAKNGDAIYVTPGTHHTLVAKKGAETAEAEATLDAGQRKSIELRIGKGGERSKVPGFIIGGVGVASLIAGGVLVGIGVSTADEVRADAPHDADGTPLCRRTPEPGTPTNPACDTWRAKAAAGSTAGNVGIGLFIAGGVALAGAAAYWLWPTKRDGGASVKWTVVPLVSAEGTGAMWMGRF